MSTAADPYQIFVFDSFAAAQSAWRALEANGFLYGFQCYDWLSTWYETIGRHQPITVHICEVRDHRGQPLLLLPLAIRKRRGVSCLLWLGGRQADYHGPIVAPSYRETVRSDEFPAFWRLVLGALPAIDVVHFTKQPETIETLPNPFLSLGAVPRDWAFFTKLEGSWDEYYRRKRNARDRANTRKHFRRLCERGAVEFSVATTPARRQAVTEIMFEQKQQRYFATRSTNILREPGSQEFYRSLALAPSAMDRIHVSALQCGGDIVATHWGMLFRNRWYWLMPSFAGGDWGRYSPGRILLENLLQWCFQNGVAVFDFTIGGERYKLDWCEEQMRLFEYIEPLNAKGRAYQAWHGALTFLRRNRILGPILRRLKWHGQQRRWRSSSA